MNSVKNTPFGHQNARNGSGDGEAKNRRISVANFQAETGAKRGDRGRFSESSATGQREGSIFPGEVRYLTYIPLGAVNSRARRSFLECYEFGVGER